MDATQQKQLMRAARWASVRTCGKWVAGAVVACALLVPYYGFRLRLAEARADHEQGLAFYYQGRYAEAIRRFRQEAQTVPYFSGAYDCWGLALQKQGHLPEAIALYRKALRLDPSSCYAHDNLGWALAEQGDWRGCLAERRIAVCVGPDNPAAHRLLGDTLDHLGQEQEARKEWQRAGRLGDAGAVQTLRRLGLR